MAVLAGLLLGGFAPLHGAGTQLPRFSTQTSLVDVYATVTDAHGSPVTGLRREDFTVEEDGVPQRIDTFATGDAPLALALAVDRSFSISAETLREVRGALRRFLDDLPATDQCMLIGVGSDTEVAAPLGSSRDAVVAALTRLDRWGTTPLFDAVAQVLDAIQPASGRRAVILVSDGRDRYSMSTTTDVVQAAREHDVLVYPIAIGPLSSGRGASEGDTDAVWREVAGVSGGRAVRLPQARDLGPALARIVDELRHQYLLGYAPPEGREGWRSISVRVNRPDVRVRARDGYRASAR